MACVAAAVAGQPAAAARFASASASTTAPSVLRHSGTLWATIDVCTPIDQPQIVGVRGSMPGDHQSADEEFMRFRLQIYDAVGGRWADLRTGSSPAFVRVGSGRSAHQGGWSFRLASGPHKPRATLRGVVTFQWRHGASVILSVSRATTSGHESVLGADPAGFSAATCSVG